jgi:hypothetical protein
MDPAEQLARLYQAGFDVQTFERYPKAIGVIRDGVIALFEATPDGLRMIGVPVIRDGVIALFEATPDGLRMIGVPGWRMGEVMGVLVDRQGRQVFQAKSEVIDATAEKLERLRRFREEVEILLTAKA